MQYLSQSARDEVQRILEMAGAGASRNAPLAWLRMEHGSNQIDKQVDVSLTTWPAGLHRRLATASNHGTDVCWLLT
jgi:hypothetical protein